MSKDSRIKSVSILGCGWLGIRLSDYLISLGYQVKGSTTQKSKIHLLKQKNIDPFLIKLTPEIEAEKIEIFLDSQTLVLNIPPGIRRLGNQFHLQQINHLLPYIQSSSIKNIIYISSTSVYPNVNREINEDYLFECSDANTEDKETVSHTLIKAEALIQSLADRNTTILRPGGLIGEDRIPGKYIAGKKNLTTGAVPVNYIHPVDLVRIIEGIIDKKAWNDTFNVVAPMHPTRREVYAQNVRDFGFDPPEYDEDRANFKVINADKITQKLGYKYIYPDPLTFKYNQ